MAEAEDPTQVMEEPPTEPIDPDPPTEVMQTVATSDSFQYEQYQPQERLAAVRGKERELESQHFQARLNLIVAPADQSDAIVAQISDLESSIMELRQEEDQVEAQQPEEPPAA